MMLSTRPHDEIWAEDKNGRCDSQCRVGAVIDLSVASTPVTVEDPGKLGKERHAGSLKRSVKFGSQCRPRRPFAWNRTDFDPEVACITVR